MSNMLIVRPIAPDALTVVGGLGAPGAGSGAPNLLSPDPKEVYSCGGGGGFRDITVSYDRDVLIDTIFVGFVGNAPIAAADISHQRPGGPNVNLYAHYLAPTSRADVARRHILTRLPAPALARSIRIAVNTMTNSVMTIGVVLVGLAFQPRRNREWGGGRRPIDTGTVDALPGGGFGIGGGVVKSSFRWTLGDLDDEELDRLDELAMDRGNRRPVLVVEDPDVDARLHQRIHYGLLDRFEFYERQDASKNRWAMSVTDWA